MLQVITNESNPLDVEIKHEGQVVPLHVRAPHIREVKAALITIKDVCNIKEPSYLEAIDTIERFVYTR